MREKFGFQLLSSLCRLNNQIPTPTISKLPAVSLQFSRFESEYVSREKRIAAKAKYKPYTWEERNQFYYPKIERRSEQLNEILHRDTPLNPDATQERYAEICFARPNIPYQPKVLWYYCELITNTWIDDALAQLSALPSKGARIMEETLLHAQDIAIEEHHVEFKWNLHVAFCSVQRTRIEKGIRHHLKFPDDPMNEFGHTKRRYSNIQLMLREGPPSDLSWRKIDGHEREKFFLDKLRKRRILHSW
ncbi:large ribosomal subunit protein uL22m-like [Convolutriloba macropyga]|uniref:large ribosomal subunit protein uL22m-like n=1 Tax=Convolutriloba macropyga TaxID=536237 RepID=UPI003F524C1E